MSLTFEDLTLILNINNISKQIYRYVPIFLFLFGIIGNLMSILVFIQRTLRTNPCAMYFLAASLSNLTYLLTLLSPMLDAWDETFNLINTVSGLCKFTMFIILTARTLALWFIVLAAIDRYLVSSTNNNRRQLSSLKQSYLNITIVCIIAILMWIESIYCFDANLIGTPLKCYTTSQACKLYNDLTLALITITIPIILMLIFGLLTTVNIRQSNRRINPTVITVVTSNSTSRRTEQVLTRMLFTQVFLITILNLPHAVFIIYLTITFDQPRTPVQGTIGGFIFNILLLLPFVSSCTSFLLYTLTGKIFRETLVQLIKKMITSLTCNR